jgi:hypothetical protein
MSCPRKRFPASTAPRPIDNEAVRATNLKLAEMMAERERQDKAMAFTQDKAMAFTQDKAMAFTQAAAPSPVKTVSTDRRRGEFDSTVE